MNNAFVEQLEELKDDYISELEFKKSSKETLKSYESTIRYFIQFVSQSKKAINFKNFKVGHIIKYLQYREELYNEEFQKNNPITLEEDEKKELKNSTKNLYVRHLNKFFSYCETEADELLDFSKVFSSGRIKFKEDPKEPKGLKDNADKTKVLEYFESNIIKAKSFKNSKQLVAYRNSFLTKIALFSGGRATELCNIKLTDFIDVNENLFKIKLIGKGNKKAHLLLIKDVVIDEYEYFKSNGINDLAQTTRGNKLDRTQLWKIVKRAYKECGIDDLTLHGLRHSFAKDFYARTKDIQLLQQAMRHSSMNSTSIYSHLHEEKVEEGYEKAYIDN